VRVLGISTSSDRGSVALWRDGAVVGRCAYEGSMHHAELLFAALDELLTTAGLERTSIQAIGCDVGPGSFTGVRAGLAAAKGLALGLGAPLVGVGSLEALAAAAFAALPAEQVALAACLLDAKRGETFLAVYDRGLGAMALPAHVRTDEALSALGPWLARPEVWLVGQQCLALPEPLDRSRVLAAELCALPDATWVAGLAALRLASSAEAVLGDVEPVYIRAPDAVPAPSRKRLG